MILPELFTALKMGNRAEVCIARAEIINNGVTYDYYLR
jgi:hypothetical protein